MKIVEKMRLTQLHGFVWLLILSMVGIYSCKKDDGEFSRLSELGTETSLYSVSAAAGEVEVDVLSNEEFEIIVSEDAAWMRNNVKNLSGDTSFVISYDENTEFPRQGFVTLYAKVSERYDTVTVRQQGAKNAELLFPTLNTTILGDGGVVTSELQTNISLDDVDIQVIYPLNVTDEWVNDDFAYDEATETFRFSVRPNPDMDALRSVQVKLSFTDGWGEQQASTLYLLQANAQNLFGTEATYPEVRLWAGAQISADLFIEGHVVSDVGNKNVGETLQTTPTAINYERNDRTVYIQSLDGKYGFRLETATVGDNVFRRYGKVQLLLKGTSVEMQNNPNFYTIRGVTSAMVMKQEQGVAANLAPKEKYMSELTDDDIFTYVTLKDCELPIRKGPFTPLNEGYTTLFNAHRTNMYPLLMRDIQGASMFLLTNTNTPYRRDGSILPQGSGKVSGIIVHEKFTRFEYEDASNPDDYGNIGRYQIRHLAKADIALADNVNNGFSALLAEYQYPNITAGVAYPTNGDNGKLYASNNVNVTATSDYTYLGPVGANNLGNNNQWGTGVLVNGAKQNTHANTNSDGKGGAANSGIAANRSWWNYEKNRGEAWVIEFSTSGITTNSLSMQFTAANWASAGAGTPRYWAVEWSEHGNMDGVWTPITNYTVPDIANWSNTLLHQLAGFKNIDVPLPTSMLGKNRVYLRLMVDRNLASNGNTYASQPLAGNSNTALGYVAIRYNK